MQAIDGRLGGVPCPTDESDEDKSPDGRSDDDKPPEKPGDKPVPARFIFVGSVQPTGTLSPTKPSLPSGSWYDAAAACAQMEGCSMISRDIELTETLDPKDL